MKTKCPYCNYLATEHETLDNQKNPKKGDVSICIKCGNVSRYFKDNLVMIKVDSLDKITQKEVRKIQTAWLIIKK